MCLMEAGLRQPRNVTQQWWRQQRRRRQQQQKRSGGVTTSVNLMPAKQNQNAAIFSKDAKA
jgi:hypothetical protein